MDVRRAFNSLGFVALIGPLLFGINVARASQSPASVAAFVALAKHGLTGTYTEVYSVAGAADGTVEDFQQAPAGRFPFPTGHGKWSFLFRAQTGFSSQWVEEGSTAWDCWRATTSTIWSCSGPGRYEDSNSFALAVQPYIPGVVSSDGSELEMGLKEKAPQVENLDFSESTSAQFGPLHCLIVDGITTCIDRSGVMVSQHGGSYWSSVTLVRRSSSVPRSAFTLVGKSTSGGSHFIVVPS